MKYEIDSDNILKAHKEGCSDVKKVLEVLAPDLFKNKYPYYGKSDEGIILFTAPNTGYWVKGHTWKTLTFLDCWKGDLFTPCEIEVKVK